MRLVYSLVIGFLLLTSLRSQGVQDGLVFYAPFDGSTVNLVGWDKPVNHGASFVANKFGEPNRAMAFDGLQDYLDYGNILNLGRSNFSISLWVKVAGFYAGEAYGLGGKIINKGLDAPSHDGFRGFGVRAVAFADSGNNFRFITANGTVRDGNPKVQYTDKFGLEVDTWYHLVLTRSGKFTQLYLNNELIITGVAPEVANVDHFGPFAVGALLPEEAGEASEFFHGQLDELRIYNRRLSARDIHTLYEQFTLGEVGPTKNVPPEIPLTLKVYPNPASRLLYLEFSAAADRKLSILDPMGRRIRYQRMAGQKEEIPVAGLPPGTYFLRIEEGNRVVTKQFLKTGAVLP